MVFVNNHLISCRKWPFDRLEWFSKCVFLFFFPPMAEDKFTLWDGIAFISMCWVSDYFSFSFGVSTSSHSYTKHNIWYYVILFIYYWTDSVSNFTFRFGGGRKRYVFEKYDKCVQRIKLSSWMAGNIKQNKSLVVIIL